MTLWPRQNHRWGGFVLPFRALLIGKDPHQQAHTANPHPHFPYSTDSILLSSFSLSFTPYLNSIIPCFFSTSSSAPHHLSLSRCLCTVTDSAPHPLPLSSFLLLPLKGAEVVSLSCCCMHTHMHIYEHAHAHTHISPGVVGHQSVLL